MENDNIKYLKNFVLAFLLCGIVAAVVIIILKQKKSKFNAEEKVVSPKSVPIDKTEATTETTTEATPTIENIDTVIEVDDEPQTVVKISQEYVLENYEKPMLKNRVTNVIENGRFVILQESSDVLQRAQLNTVLTSMYFPSLHIYVVRGIYGESIVNCFVDAKTLEFVRVNSDYTGDSVLQSSGNKRKPNEPLEEILKMDNSKQYYPDFLQKMISENEASFLQRTTMNTYGVDSKRLY
jgi:hypothetical protein